MKFAVRIVTSCVVENHDLDESEILDKAKALMSQDAVHIEEMEIIGETEESKDQRAEAAWYRRQNPSQ